MANAVVTRRCGPALRYPSAQLANCYTEFAGGGAPWGFPTVSNGPSTSRTPRAWSGRPSPRPRAWPPGSARRRPSTCARAGPPGSRGTTDTSPSCASNAWRSRGCSDSRGASTRCPRTTPAARTSSSPSSPRRRAPGCGWSRRVSRSCPTRATARVSRRTPRVGDASWVSCSPTSMPPEHGPDPESVAEQVFTALADPTRRSILAALAAGGPATATDLADRLPITRQAIAKHLALLADVGLVTAEPGERRRVRFRLRSAPMRVAQQFLAALARDWDGPLDALTGYLDRGQ